MKIGQVISTFGSVPYIHMQLESRKRFGNNVQCLVHDDSSSLTNELKSLCDLYGVQFYSTPTRFGHQAGDAHAIYYGLLWAIRNDFDVLVKTSRRFIPVEFWVDNLASLADKNSSPSFTEVDTIHLLTYNIGMRVEFWLNHLNNIKAFIEGRTKFPCLEQLLFAINSEYAYWCPKNLWRRINPVEEYAEQARIWDLEYNCSVFTNEDTPRDNSKDDLWLTK
jgi:hypothetical protein